MTDNQGVAGSQAGQQGSGSQEGQSNASQNQQQGSGSQEGQGQQQQPYFNEQYMQQGETVEQALARLHGAMETARKQAAGYRQRLNGNGSGSQEGQSQQGENQGQNNQQGNADITALQREIQQLKQDRAADKTRTTLIDALAKAGAVNPARAYRLIDLDTADIEDDGTVIDPDGVVRALKADTPQMFQDTVGNADGGSGNNSGGDADFNAEIRRKAGVGR